MHSRIKFLTCLNADGQTISWGGHWTGCKIIERTRRVIRFVKIEDRLAVFAGHGRIYEAPGRVCFVAGRGVSEYIEQAVA